MNILYVGTGCASIRKEGHFAVEKVIYGYIDNLVRMGIKVGVIDVGSESSVISGVKYFNIMKEPTKPLLPDKISFFRIIYIFIFSILSCLTVMKITKKEKYDIIHIHTQIPAFILIIARKLFLFKGIIVYTSHNAFLYNSLDSLRRYLYIFEIMVLKFADHSFVQTETVRKQINSFLKIPMGKMSVIGNGIDGEVYFKNKSGEQYKIICVSRISRRKNQLILLKALPNILSKYSVIVRLIGPIEDFDYLDEITNYIENNGLQKNVTIEGPLTNENFKDAMADASIFIFPTLYETFGLVMIEACAFRLPVVASDIPILKEISHPYEDAIMWFNPDSPKDLAEKVILVIENTELRYTMIDNGIRIVSKYSWNNISEKLVEAYKLLLKK